MSELVRHIAVLEEPPYEPVSLAETRLYCAIDSDITAQDSVITAMIVAARERAEDITGRAFVERRLELRLDQFPTDSQQAIEIPFPPLQLVEYIRYTDTSGTEHEMSGSPDQFFTDTGSTPGRIAPLYGASWPSSNGMPGNVRIGFRCGYAQVGSPSAEDTYQAGIPKRLKLWMWARVSTWYQNRDHLDLATLKDLPRDFVDGLLDGLVAHRRFA